MNCTGLIEQGQYYVIHAARQSGKTTLLLDLVTQLNEDGAYHAAHCSLESVEGITDPKEGIPTIFRPLRTEFQLSGILGEVQFDEGADLSDFIGLLKVQAAKVCQQLDKPLLLFFDEADCLSNGTLIAFLRQLRAGYVNRSRFPFAHSVALVGMRNIRDDKASLREDQATLGSASPFNIVKRSLTLRSFTAAEVAERYRQHTVETGQEIDPTVVDRVYHFTRGQPWLVNAIAAHLRPRHRESVG